MKQSQHFLGDVVLNTHAPLKTDECIHRRRGGILLLVVFVGLSACFNNRGQDCTPKDCIELAKECGLWDDGCGTEIRCGPCPSGQPCSPDGMCEDGQFFQHVWPADVGQTIGVGVTGTVPTEEYTGSDTIEEPGAVIENKVINTCLDIYADDVTVRNCVITCGGLYAVDLRASNVTVVNNKIVCTSNSKLFLMADPINAVVANNELVGCEDFFYINGNVDGLTVENNYMHSVVGTPSSHADGFQIGEAGETFGTMTIRGNYIHKNNTEVGATDILFATNDSQQTVIIENNFLHPWGHYTLRCTTAAHCIARYNVYSLEFLADEYLDRYYADSGMDEFMCNRMEDGSWLDGSRVGVENVTADCPEFP